MDLIFVLGMHRSGTSALTGLLPSFDIDLGDNLMAGNASNRKGHFEDTEFVRLNDDLLKHYGLSWRDLLNNRKLDPAPEQFRDRAATLLRRKVKDKTFAVKDPRMCRLLDFWTGAAKTRDVTWNYLIVVRNPMAVAKSLLRRDQMPVDHAVALWVEHNRPLAERSGLVVDYDKLLADPAGELWRVAGWLGVTMPEFDPKFLESDMRHHVTNDIPAGEARELWSELYARS